MLVEEILIVKEQVSLSKFPVRKNRVKTRESGPNSRETLCIVLEKLLGFEERSIFCRFYDFC